MAALTVQDGRVGLPAVTFEAAAEAGDTVVAGIDAGGWQLGTVLIVVNASVDTDSEVTVGGVPDVVDVPFGETAVIPLKGGGISGNVLSIAYEHHEDMTVAAVRLW